MKKEKLELIHAALFHNLGRVVSRSHGRPDDIDLGKEWLKEQLPHLNFGGDNRTEKIITLASHIASGSLDENKVSKEKLFKPLADIFNAFKKKEEARYQKFEVLTESGQRRSRPFGR